MRVTCVDWLVLCVIFGVLEVAAAMLAAAWIDRRALTRHQALMTLLSEQTPGGLRQMANGLLMAVQSVDAARTTVDTMIDALAHPGDRTQPGARNERAA